jgi:hypothetical protein
MQWEVSDLYLAAWRPNDSVILLHLSILDEAKVAIR